MTIRRAGVLLLSMIAVGATGCGAPGPAASALTPAASASPPSSLAIASAGPSAAASPQPSSPSPFRVVGLVLTANPAAHIGTCPLEITFTAAMTVAGGTGTVTYHWVSSDGDTSPTKTIEVGEGRPMNVSSTWTVDPAHNPTHAGWSRIELVGPHTSTPGSVESAEAQFAFTCDTDDDIESIGFGVGGADVDCSIKTDKKLFARTDAIRMVATWRPSLAKGTTVTIRLTRDGELAAGYPVTTTFDESTRCVHGQVWKGVVPAGHYRLEAAPDTARAIAGEFDVK